MAFRYVAKKEINKVFRLLTNNQFRSITGQGLTDYEDVEGSVKFKYKVTVVDLQDEKGVKLVTAQCIARKDECGNLEITITPDNPHCDDIVFGGIARALNTRIVSIRQYVSPQT